MNLQNDSTKLNNYLQDIFKNWQDKLINSYFNKTFKIIYFTNKDVSYFSRDFLVDCSLSFTLSISNRDNIFSIPSS